MTQQIIQNLESGLVCRTKINENFTEVYAALPQGVVSVLAYGADIAAFRAAAAAVTAAGGGVLFIPPGSYSIVSADLASGGPIVLTDNTIVEGNGATITITGTAVYDQLFSSTNASNVLIRNLNCVGNNQALSSGASTGQFFAYTHNNSGTGAENIALDRVRLQNFKAERWVAILNTNLSGLGLRQIRVRDFSGVSQTGNSIAPANIAVNACCLTIYGVSAPITDIVVDNFYAAASHIKMGIELYGKVSEARIVKPIIEAAGQTGAANDSGAYAINLYGDVADTKNITVESPVLTSPRSCGVYVRGVANCVIDNPTISGQTDTVSGTLPKGAIASNGSTGLRVTGGRLSSNVFDVFVVAPATGSVVDFQASGVTTRGATTSSFSFNPNAGTGFAEYCTIENCDIQATGFGVRVFNAISGARYIRSLRVLDSIVTSSGNSAIELNTFGASAVANYQLHGLTIKSAANGISADNLTGDIWIDSCDFEDIGTSLQTYGLLAQNCTNLNLANLTFRNQGAGFALLTAGSKGVQSGIRIVNVTNGVGPSSMGLAAPGTAGATGDFVQNLAPVEAGSTPNKYVNTGWRYASGAWLQQRTLTGN